HGVPFRSRWMGWCRWELAESLKVLRQVFPLLFLEQEVARRGAGEVALDVGPDGGIDWLEAWLLLWLLRRRLASIRFGGFGLQKLGCLLLGALRLGAGGRGFGAGRFRSYPGSGWRGWRRGPARFDQQGEIT